MTRTLSDAHPATGAALEIYIVPFVGAQLDNGIFRTRRQAVVAFETVAAREAALRFPDCRRFVQTGNDFLERLRSFFHRAFALQMHQHVAENRQVEHPEGDDRVFWRPFRRPRAEASIDVNARLLAAADGNGDSAFARDQVAAGKDSRA